MDVQLQKPFYEVLANRFGQPLVSRFIIAAAPALIFLIPHLFTFDATASPKEPSWLLALIIFSAIVFIYYATRVFLNLLPRLQEISINEDMSYFHYLQQAFNTNRFVLAGVIFAVLNTGMGCYFGIPYAVANQADTVFTLYLGFALAGFACGMPVYGIWLIWRTINLFAQTNKIQLDFTSPDRCAGVAFIGTALIKFAGVTLVVGVMIALYIVKTEWDGLAGPDPEFGVKLAVWFWIIFPFVMSGLVLLAPAVEIGRLLDTYKLEQQRIVQKAITKLQDRMRSKSVSNEEQDMLKADYENQIQFREKLYSMRTWPFSQQANASYLGLVAANLALIFKTAETLEGGVKKVLGILS